MHRVCLPKLVELVCIKSLLQVKETITVIELNKMNMDFITKICSMLSDHCTHTYLLFLHVFFDLYPWLLLLQAVIAQLMCLLLWNALHNSMNSGGKNTVKPPIPPYINLFIRARRKKLTS